MKELKISKYEVEKEGYFLGVKRLYIPYEIKWNCPNCQEEQMEDYFEVPVATEENIESVKERVLVCEVCDHKETIEYKVSIGFQADFKKNEA